MSRAGSPNRAIRFSLDIWRDATDGLTRIEQSVLLDIALYNWQHRQGCPDPVLRMMFLDAGEYDALASLVGSGHVSVIDGRFSARVVLDMKRRPVTGRLAGQPWAEIKARVFARDNYTCRYCKTRGARLECDHIYPVVLGGSDDESNLATACMPCNRAKGARTLEQMGWTI